MRFVHLTVAKIILLLPSLCLAQTLPVVPWFPDFSKTPGLVNYPATPLSILCHLSTKNVRNVSDSEKKQVLKSYNISFAGLNKDQKKEFRKTIEIDHLIPLELDGANGKCVNHVCDLRNLWPQTRSKDLPNAAQKDELENVLHKMTCANPPQISLQQAQHDIAVDWWSAYKKYVDYHHD
jgi:hypothetical protein